MKPLRDTHRDRPEQAAGINRRGVVLRLGGLVGAVVGGGFLRGLSADGASAAQAEGFGSAAVASGAVS